MRIMAFEAHPDDIEHFCAGTLAKYAAMGHQTAIVSITNGEVGSPTHSKEEIAAIRHDEAAAAAAIIGAEFFWLGYPDEFLFNSEEVRLNIINTIRAFRPHLILGLDKDNDYHPDHTTAGQLVWDTHVMVTVPNIVTDAPPCEIIPDIFFMDTPAGINFVPESYVDITDYWETKAAMLGCHNSQETWCMAQYGCSLAENAAVQSRFRGYQSGTAYAEAFRKVRFFPERVAKDGLLPTALHDLP